MSHSIHMPLKGLTVVDLSLFLAGPYAALRLQDLGARVIKIERPDGGDPCRNLYKTKNAEVSTLFHAINRGKESVALDLKNPADLQAALQLLDRADVVIQNYRPGVADRLGLGHQAISARNPRIVYASISGYGAEGEWAGLPGQDLLAQARSGFMWLNGNAGDPPTPTGLALADIYTGALAAQGVLAGLVGRGQTGKGCLVETSLFEAMLDMQFEMLADYLNHGREMPQRSAVANANVNAPPPYGVYATSDGYLALAMTPLERLAELLGIEGDIDETLLGRGRERDNFKSAILDKVAQKTTDEWLEILEPEGIWCAPVLNWEQMLETPQLKSLNMLQSLERSNGSLFHTTALPITFNGTRPVGQSGAPSLGEHTDAVLSELTASNVNEVVEV